MTDPAVIGSLCKLCLILKSVLVFFATNCGERNKPISLIENNTLSVRRVSGSPLLKGHFTFGAAAIRTESLASSVRNHTNVEIMELSGKKERFKKFCSNLD